MSTDINLPQYYQPENAYVKSSNNPFNSMITGLNESWQNLRKSLYSGKLGLILLLILLIFVSIVCWMNMVAYIRIAYNEDDNQGISITWAIFGSVVNGVFATIALGFSIYLLVKIFRKETEEQKMEKQSRKFIGSVIDGARLTANKTVRDTLKLTNIDIDDIDSSKSYIVTTTNAHIDNALDRYKFSVLENIIEQ
jgi:hypothetical protein